MKLKKAIEIGTEACGLETPAECVNNILIHVLNLFAYEDIEDETRELKLEAADQGILFCNICGMAIREDGVCGWCESMKGINNETEEYIDENNS